MLKMLKSDHILNITEINKLQVLVMGCNFNINLTTILFWVTGNLCFRALLSPPNHEELE